MSENNSSKWEDLASMDQEQVEIDETVVDKAEPETENATPNQASEEAALEHPDYETLQKQLLTAESKAHENWEKALRATAEMENIRRRAERDVESAHKYGNEKFINSLLPVIDSLEQALQTEVQEGSDSLQSMKQGIELTLKLFLDSLEKANVKQIEPVGETFDPQQHEAMSMQPAPEGTAANTVLMVFQKGYLLNERVIRPARVIVAK